MYWQLYGTAAIKGTSGAACDIAWRPTERVEIDGPCDAVPGAATALEYSVARDLKSDVT
jgi:hypothetical protein